MPHGDMGNTMKRSVATFTGNGEVKLGCMLENPPDLVGTRFSVGETTL
jgi:hypothetical protein